DGLGYIAARCESSPVGVGFKNRRPSGTGGRAQSPPCTSRDSDRRHRVKGQPVSIFIQRVTMKGMQRALLASAAALVVVGGAPAADLPTGKGTPAAEYVKVCHVDGAAGFVIPGSDTCLKISGSLM